MRLQQAHGPPPLGEYREILAVNRHPVNNNLDSVLEIYERTLIRAVFPEVLLRLSSRTCLPPQLQGRRRASPCA